MVFELLVEDILFCYATERKHIVVTTNNKGSGKISLIPSGGKGLIIF